MSFNPVAVLIQFFGYREEDKGYYTGIVASSIFIGGIVSRFVVILSGVGQSCQAENVKFLEY